MITRVSNQFWTWVWYCYILNDQVVTNGIIGDLKWIKWCKLKFCGLLISECLFDVSNFPKENQRKIWQISALEYKSGQINKKNAPFYNI